MNFITLVFCLVISNYTFANTAETHFTENKGLKKIPVIEELSQDQINKSFRESLEIRNEAMVKNRIELIRMQNEMMLMERMRDILTDDAEKEDQEPVIFRTGLDAEDITNL